MKKNAFTLIELLIVIAIIGVLAVVLLAAINPIEQINRSRDTGKRTDAAQLLSAIDRYFTANEKFPWTTALTSFEDAFAFTSANTVAAADGTGVGVCGATCATGGLLLTTEELKSEFLKRDFITSTAAHGKDYLYVGKAAGGTSSVYVCWVPTSKSERANAIYDTAFAANTTSPQACTVVGAALTWTNIASSCFICLPE